MNHFRSIVEAHGLRDFTHEWEKYKLSSSYLLSEFNDDREEDNTHRIHLPNGLIKRICERYVSYEKSAGGNLHREDGPAIIDSGGSYSWYLNGKFHRTDGPAVYDIDLSMKWAKHGLLHRLDGPAIINYGGASYSYYVNGRSFKEEEFYKHFGD